MMYAVIAAESVTAQREIASTRDREYEGVALVESGEALTCVLTLLETLTPDQLHTVRMDHLPAILRRVAQRDATIRQSVESPCGCRLPPPEAGDVLADTLGDDAVPLHRLADDGGRAH
jgi:hypothetical protein